MKALSTALFDQKVKSMEAVPEQVLEQLHDCAAPRFFKKGGIVHPEGQVCKKIFFVEQGLLRTYYNQEGKEINLRFTPEEHFTTLLSSLQKEQPSEYVVEAMEPTALWELDKRKLLSLYNRSPVITSFGRKLLEQLLEEEEAHSLQFKRYTPTERYQLLVRDHASLLQRISLTHLASYLAISRETLSRIRKKKN
ncbi:MAG TPA: Crp/Fnr family transcriptional regulator [Flavisolibacter sp.]|jgi:CRP-like cAMP-binding protein|nr:Crp/Fnr family transcriptional regulator [Flavisolibacter sp.]